jgi:hypothetical protein
LDSLAAAMGLHIDFDNDMTTCHSLAGVMARDDAGGNENGNLQNRMGALIETKD